MNHWIIAPVVLPALAAPLVVLAMRYDLFLQRVVSLAVLGVLVLVAAGMVAEAAAGAVDVYRLGNWPAPFGIVLVLDRLAAIMLLATAILGLVVALYAIGTGWDTRGQHFHALLLFQLMGLNGAFLTGDAFNLFVFFEVLLIASYGLMIHSGGPARLKAGVQYVVFNLVGSALFLFGLGTLYAVTGTLNMADMGARLALMPPGDMALVRVGAALLFLVFAIKAALVPLQFWLPGTYANAPGPVAALFAIMTKVGCYAILRMFTLVFGPDQPGIGGDAGAVLLPAAAATIVIGALGVMGAGTLPRMAAFATISSVGTLLAALSRFTPDAVAAGLYYMLHSIVASAALFLVADLVTGRRGALSGRLVAGAPMAQAGMVAGLYFAATIGLAGLPPLSGFIGKLLVLDALRASPLVWATILGGSLVMVVGFARAGSMLFWTPIEVAASGRTLPEAEPAAPALPFFATASLAAGMVVLAVLAGPVTRYLDATARQLFDRDLYVASVIAPAAPASPPAEH